MSYKDTERERRAKLNKVTDERRPAYLDKAQGKSSMRYKCLNPACRHEWETRGDYAKIIRCTSCRKGYVVEKYIFDGAVAEDRKVLDYANAATTKAYEVYLDALSNVVRKLFPMLPFNPFQVIYEEAKGYGTIKRSDAGH